MDLKDALSSTFRICNIVMGELYRVPMYFFLIHDRVATLPLFVKLVFFYTIVHSQEFGDSARPFQVHPRDSCLQIIDMSIFTGVDDELVNLLSPKLYEIYLRDSLRVFRAYKRFENAIHTFENTRTPVFKGQFGATSFDVVSYGVDMQSTCCQHWSPRK
jgi:hypothetical protein